MQDLKLLPDDLRQQVESSLRSDRRLPAHAEIYGNELSGLDGQGWTGTEKDLQVLCERLLHTRGWIFFHMIGAAAAGNPAGWPDLICFGPGGRLLLIELKTARGKLREKQEMLFGRLRARGHDVHVCRSVDDVCALIEQN